MRKSRFEGGSKLVSFRLPLVGLNDVKAKIKALIDSYEVSEVVPLEEVVSTVIEPKAVKVVKEVVKVVEPTVMASECGCEYVGTLFMRSKGCKIPKEHHLPR